MDYFKGEKISRESLKIKISEGKVLSNKILVDLNLTNINLDGVSIENSKIIRCKLSLASMQGTTLKNVTVHQSSLKNVFGLDLIADNVEFTDVDFTNFYGGRSSFIKCYFHKCKMKDAYFLDATLKQLTTYKTPFKEVVEYLPVNCDIKNKERSFSISKFISRMGFKALFILIFFIVIYQLIVIKDSPSDWLYLLWTLTFIFSMRYGKK